MRVGNRHHQLDAQEALKPAPPWWATNSRFAAGLIREQQGSLRPSTQLPGGHRDALSVHQATLLEKTQRKEKHVEELGHLHKLL